MHFLYPLDQIDPQNVDKERKNPWSWVSFSGPDSKDFLHRLTTVHVKALSPGQGSPGFFLTAQGKVRAYFQLWCLGENQYAFEFDSGVTGQWKQELFSVIDQFTFGEKLELKDQPQGLNCTWIFSDLSSNHSPLLSLLPQENSTLFLEGEQIRLCRHSNQSFGKLWISAWGPKDKLDTWIQSHLQNTSPTSFEKLEDWRIQNVSPRVDVELTFQSVPLEIGLRHAIAEQKGCYPGQEVIERVISIGSPARRLALIHTTSDAGSKEILHEIKPGDSIQTSDDSKIEIGKVTSVAPLSKSSTEMSFLAIIRKTHAKEGMKINVISNEKPDQKAFSAVITKLARYDESAC